MPRNLYEILFSGNSHYCHRSDDEGSGQMQYVSGRINSGMGRLFRLTYIENTGAAFSMLSGQRLILVLVPVIAICGGLIYLHRHRGRHWSLYTSWAMIIGGGIGNLFDRVVFASVTDMFDFSIFPPVFNVADIGVTLGCALMVIYILKYSEQN